jgi:hypothetical protein
VDHVLVTWLAGRAPFEKWVWWSRWALAVGSTLTLVQTVWIYGHVLGGTTVQVPRFSWLDISLETVMLGVGIWAIGNALLATGRWWSGAGWLLPAGALFTMLLDRQSSLGSFGLLVVLFSTLHWMSALLEEYGLHGAPLRLIQTQVSVVFLWTALAKLTPIFLSGSLLAVSFRGPVPLPFDPAPAGFRTLALVIVCWELLVAVGLWLPSLRKALLVGVAGFHIAIILFLTPTLGLAAFAATMGCGYVLFAAEPWSVVSDDS